MESTCSPFGGIEVRVKDEPFQNPIPQIDKQTLDDHNGYRLTGPDGPYGCIWTYSPMGWGGGVGPDLPNETT